jgi:hypothetical protein
MDVGREANNKASEWLPRELLTPQAAKQPAADDQRRAAKANPSRDFAPEPQKPRLPTPGKRALKAKNPTRDWVPTAEVDRLNGSSAPSNALPLPTRHVQRRAQPPAPRHLEPSLDLNQARFDQLCGLGLAPHQAAGVIGRREQRGGFDSVHDLDELDGKYGLAREKIEALKSAVAV